MIAEARRRAGLTQAALSRRAGISASYLSRIESGSWERGGPLPADGVLRALARALDLSSTALVALRQAAKDGRTAPTGRGGAHRRSSYSVSMGPSDVDRAARDLVGRNPSHGTLRSAQVFMSGGPGGCELGPSYLDALGSAMEAQPDAILYRVCASDRPNLGTVRSTVDRLAGGRPPGQAGNVRTRIAFSNPLVLDVLVGDHEVLLAVPDRRGAPRLRAGVVVDDPDFVAAVRDWFDESVWDPPCGYADVRGEGIDDAFAAIDEWLGQRRTTTIEQVGPGAPARRASAVWSGHDRASARAT